jgi:hypothetical protein
VLARLNQIDGVESTDASLGIEGGSLVRVTLRPGADPTKVAEQVQRVLGEEIPERTVEPVAPKSATAALQRNEWLDTGQLANIAARERGPSERRTSILLALLFVVICLGLYLLGRRYLRHRRTDPAAPRLLPRT